MKKTKLYWNNVCLFNRMEETFIKEEIEKAGMEDVLEVAYFGLGRERKLADQIKEDLKNGIIPDVIITTDLDVFHDKHMMFPFIKEFKSLKGRLELSDQIKESTIRISEDKLLPFIVIPQVIVINRHNLKGLPVPKSLKDLAKDMYKDRFTFGGIHNSAGRSIIKSIWAAYGQAVAKKIVANAQLANMPAMAFNSVIRGQVPIAIVPSIFAERAGANNIELICPSEGLVAIPSYIGMKSDVPEAVCSFIIDKIISLDKQMLLYERGKVLPVSCTVEGNYYHQHKLLYPSWAFIEEMDDNEFYEVCQY